MEKRITDRLKELQSEYQKGQDRLVALEKETTKIQTSLFRISGAIQVLEELLESDRATSTGQESKKSKVELTNAH